MAWSLIAHKGAGSSDSGASVTTAAVNTTGADALFILLTSWQGATAPAVSDSAGNVWNLDKTGNDTVNLRSSIYRASSPVKTSATHTVTAAGTTCYGSVDFLAFSGSNGGTIDVSASANSSNTNVTTLSTGSVTPSQDNSLILAALATSTGGATYAATSPLNLADSTDFGSLQHFGNAGGYYIQPTATAFNPNFTFASCAANGVTAVYKPNIATYVAEDERRLPPSRPRHITPVEEVAPNAWPWRQGAFHTNGASSSNTISASFTAPIANGSLVTVTVGWQDVGHADTLLSLVDDKGNSYTPIPATIQWDALHTYWVIGAYCANPTGNPTTITATISTSRTRLRLLADEFIGGFSYFDTAASNNQGSSTPGTDAITSGAVTPRANNELIYGANVDLIDAGPATLVPGTNYAPGTLTNVIQSEYRVQLALASVAATWTGAPEGTNPSYVTYVATYSLAPIATTSIGADHQQELPPRRPYHRLAEQDEAYARVAVGVPRTLIAEDQRSLPPQRPRHPPADLDQGAWPFTAVATVGRLVAEEPGRLPPRRPAHASPAQDELSAVFASAPTVFKKIDEDDHHLPSRRPWHRLADVDQGGWPFTAVATIGRLIEEHRQRLPPARPWHRTPDIDEGAWPFSVAPLNTVTYLPEDEQHRPRQRPWHSLLGEDAELIVPPPTPVSLFYAYGQAGARSVG